MSPEVALPRRPCCKRVASLPGVTCFKPKAAAGGREAVVLSVEELEALRLAHLEELYQQEAAARMGVSRPTFGRVLEAAHRKVTRALVEGRTLHIAGGSFCAEAPERCARCPRRGADPAACEGCSSRVL
jgi:predicted DNA-binding protein (UPF0251 family)